MSDAPTSNGATTGRQGCRRVLVVGCGFIGSNLAIGLAAAGTPPAILTRSRPSEAVTAAIEPGDLRLGDAGDRGTVEGALDGVEHVIFSAGGLLPAASELDPALNAELMLGPLRNVLEALRGRPGVSLTYLSSGGTVYGEPSRIPVGEDDPTEPFGSYGKLHLACESEIGAARRDHGLQARILRCSTVYGEHQQPDRGQGAVATFLHRIEHGEQIDLYGDGTTIRDYLYVGDLSAAIVALLDREGGPAVLNVGSGEGTSLIDLLRTVERAIGRDARTVRHPERGFDVHQIVLDTTRLRELIDFRPTPLSEGVARTRAWLVSAVPGAA